MDRHQGKIRASFYRRQFLFAALLVSLVTLSVYIPVLQHDFLNWDDDLYVYENAHIQSPGLTSLRWMFSGFQAANWHPLTWLSHAVDYSIWGLNPLGHHLTSLLLHALNTALVVILVSRLVYSATEGGRALSPGVTGRHPLKVPLMAGAITGILFGLHPLNVESVAWVSTRKNLLSAFFFLMSVLTYVKYVAAVSGHVSHVTRHRPEVTGHPSPAACYLLCLFFFVLSLMSKPVSVMLPVVLMMLDVYPLRRVGAGTVLTSKRRVLLEKLPFLALGIAFSAVAYAAQQSAGALTPVSPAGLGKGVLVAFRALGFYLVKVVWPAGLAPWYPYPSEVSFFLKEYMVSVAFFLAVTVFCISLWKRQKVWLAVWIFYVSMLLPVSGIVKVGDQAAADRYMYLPGLGPFLLIGLGTARLAARDAVKRQGLVFGRGLAVAAVVASATLVLSAVTVQQAKMWRDSTTLWESELELFPETAYKAYYNLGKISQSRGLVEKAIEQYGNALKINPHYAYAHNNLGVIYANMGLIDRAIEHFVTAVKADPANSLAQYNLGAAYASKGHINEAIERYEVALGLESEFPEAYYGLGLAYESLGLTEKADEHFRHVRDHADGLRPKFSSRPVSHEP